jgi:hypothetical protein
MNAANVTVDPADRRIMTGEAWEAFCDALKRAGRLVLADGVPASARDRAEGFRYLTRLLAAGITTCVEHADGDAPSFGRMVDYDMRWGLDCPDCLYLYATVRGDAAYRIYGNRGSARHIDIQVNWGHFGEGEISAWGTVSAINGLELQSEADGSFALYLGGEQRDGNWLPLAPNAEFVLIRQYFNDWEREQPADLYIERIGVDIAHPPLRTGQIAARLERLSMWLEKGGGLWERMSRAALDLAPNTLAVYRAQDSDQRAGMQGQAYGIGNFRCAPDEAVIVEFTPPPCRYWSIGLADWYWQSLDFAERQTSLNGHQAALDSDGMFRAVIAHEDPGVANWLDTAGHTQGTLAARFLLADAAPQPSTRVVKLAELASALPADTPRVAAAVRAQVLARRKQAVLRRYRR